MTMPYDPVPEQQGATDKNSRQKQVLITVGGILLAGCMLCIAVFTFFSQSDEIIYRLEKLFDSSLAGNPTDTPVKETDLPSVLYKIGEKADAAGVMVTVLDVQKVKTLPLSTEESGKTYLDVEVFIENTSSDELVSYNSLDFKIKDDSAAEYEAEPDALQPTLKWGDLLRGDKVRGHVAFRVPEDTKGFILSYHRLDAEGDRQTVRVDLGQKAEKTAEVGVLAIGGSQVGKRVTGGGMAITVNKVATATSLSEIPAENGMMYVDIEVLIENTGLDEKLHYNTFDFKVKDAQFLEYESDIVSLEPALTSGELTKGEKVRGHVAFQVPAGAKQFVVRYEPQVFSDGYRPLTVNIAVP